MDRKKICHILHSVGGVDVSIRTILGHINPKLYENIIIHGETDTKNSYYDKDGFLLREYKLPIQREISLLKDFRAIINTIRILYKERPHLIHAHSTKGGIIARVANLFYGVTVLHTPQAFSYLSAEGRIRFLIFKNIERAFKKFYSILVASSDSERNRGINDLGYKPEKTELFNNSISPILGINKNVSESLEVPQQYICTVGRPSYQKNLEMMIEVMALIHKRIPGIHLMIMGVGEYSPKTEIVKKLICKHELQNNISLIKWMDRKDILYHISNSKLYISTARYEGLPYSVIESLALSKACVVTDTDGNRDLVKEGFNGHVIKDFNTQHMADKIIDLYRNDSLRHEYEKNSFRFYNENFNIDKNMYKLEYIYSKYIK